MAKASIRQVGKLRSRRKELTQDCKSGRVEGSGAELSGKE